MSKAPLTKDELNTALKVYQMALAHEVRATLASGEPTSSAGHLDKLANDIAAIRKEIWELENLEYAMSEEVEDEREAA